MLENSANSSTREGHTQQKWPQARRQCHGAMWRSLLLTGVLMVAALVATAIPAHAQEADLSINGADQVGASLAGVTAPERVAATTITVDTSEDLTPDSLTKTCGFNAGIFNAATDGCTLRRAMLEVSARPASDGPFQIVFNLASDDPNRDLEVAGTWTLPMEAALELTTPTILDKSGNVLIDGDSQPGIRTDGPGIIIVNDESLEVHSTDNVIRNLAFKGGGAIFLHEDRNTVEGIWMGLSDDGQEIAFRDPSDPKRMAGGGIVALSNENIIRNNIISGAFSRAISLDGGDDNLVEFNNVGTRADGTVPEVPEAIKCLRNFSFDPTNWYGGWGIQTSGSTNTIKSNRIAGLHILQSENDTPPMAIEIFGEFHLVEGNEIGYTSDNKVVGVCGQGIKVSGHDTQILGNLIVEARAGFESNAGGADEGSILASDTSPLFGQITIRRNIVVFGPDRLYAFGAGIKDALRFFEPAAITSITSTTINGTSGADSPCPNCIIDLYLDDQDQAQEAYSYLGATTADSDGNWSFALDEALDPNRGVRTMSTSTTSGVIGTFGGGTTSKMSKLYYPMREVTIEGPTTAAVGETMKFTMTVLPFSATKPLEFSVDITDSDAPLTTSNTTGIVILTKSWSTAGVKTIDVTVTNDLGTVQASHTITITGPSTEPEPVPMTGVTIQGPTSAAVGENVEFTMTVSPSTATKPVEFTVNITDSDAPLTTSSTTGVVTLTNSWSTPGVKTVAVTVTNELGTVQASHSITITGSTGPDPDPAGTELFLPLLLR